MGELAPGRRNDLSIQDFTSWIIRTSIAFSQALKMSTCSCSMKTTREYSSTVRQTPYRIFAVGFARSAMLAILALAISFCAAPLADAHPGDLDTSFGTNGTGKIIMHFNGFVGENATSVAVQRNGKIVLGAESNYRDAAARFNPNGRLDSTFASQGILNRLVINGETSFGTK